MVQALKKIDRQLVPYKNVDEPTKPKSEDKKKWAILTLLIATYGFLKNISPECPYIAEFLSGPRFNFTQIQVTQEIYPISTYGSVIQTFIVLLVTDVFRYKPIIVVGAVGFILHKALLVWGHSFLDMQMNQFFWGTSKACSLAYKTYIYSMVSREHFQKVTAVIRIAPKVGTLASSIFSQVALSVFFMTIEQLNFISMWASMLALVCALLLPSLKHSLYFEPPAPAPAPAFDSHPSGSSVIGQQSRWRHAVNLLWQDFKDAYTNPLIVKWCVWWILATAFFQLVTDYYVQVLWTAITGGNTNKYNAGVEAMYTIISGLVCYMAGGLAVNWHRWGELMLGLLTITEGVLLFWSASTLSIFTSYGIYITFGTLYDVLMVISNSEVAKYLKNESFALIFGINSFLALSFQSLLTYLFTSKNALSLPIRDQFLGIGAGFLALGICFILKAIFNCFNWKNNQVKVASSFTPGLKTPQNENTDHSNSKASGSNVQ